MRLVGLERLGLGEVVGWEFGGFVWEQGLVDRARTKQLGVQMGIGVRDVSRSKSRLGHPYLVVGMNAVILVLAALAGGTPRYLMEVEKEMKKNLE